MPKRMKIISGVILFILVTHTSTVLANFTWQYYGSIYPGGATTMAVDPTRLEILVGASNGLRIRYNTNYNSWGDQSYLQTGSVYSIKFDPNNANIVYLGTELGVFKNDNAVNNGIYFESGSGKGVLSLAIDSANSQIVYAGTSVGGGVFKSMDGGESWTAINSGLPSTITVRSLDIAPTNPKTLYAGTASDGVFKSIDGGNSWSAINSGLASNYVSCLAIDPSNSQTIYVEAGNLFKTTDGGKSWKIINNGLDHTGAYTIVIDPSNSEHVYIGTSVGVYMSIDGGSYWSKVVTSGQIRALVFDPINSKIIYGLSDQGIHFGGTLYKGLFFLDAPTISSSLDATVTTATVSAAYSFTPSSTDASSFVITGSVPPGMTFDTRTGTLSGTPTTAGSYNIAITVINASGSASLPVFTINVAPKPASVPIMEGWWLLPGMLAGVGIFARRRKE